MSLLKELDCVLATVLAQLRFFKSYYLCISGASCCLSHPPSLGCSATLGKTIMLAPQAHQGSRGNIQPWEQSSDKNWWDQCVNAQVSYLLGETALRYMFNMVFWSSKQRDFSCPQQELTWQLTLYWLFLLSSTSLLLFSLSLNNY
jgi:hypothetical protein